MLASAFLSGVAMLLAGSASSADVAAPTCTVGTCPATTAAATYLIGSGWHATPSGLHPLSKINSRVDATVRTQSWFPLWYAHLVKFAPAAVQVREWD
jgi:hypothetical protein